MERTPPWPGSPLLPEYPSLVGDFRADVAVVGGGVCGLSAATILQKAGSSVALVESRRIGHGETGASTAHLTEVLDTRYHVLQSKFGSDGAALAAEASRAAIGRIEAFARSVNGGCGFARLPGYLYAETQAQRRELERESRAMADCGVKAEWTDATQLPWRVKGALRIENQAQLNPAGYLRALAHEFTQAGGRIFENTPLTDYTDGEPCRISTPAGIVLARDVLIASGVPVSNKFWIHTKIAAYRTYAIAAPFSDPLEPALYWDMHEPYHYLRIYSDGKQRWLILGGEDHKTGQQPDTDEPFQRLAYFLRKRFGELEIGRRWSGQIIQPADGLPFMGMNTASSHTYVATGFAGNGITLGTLGAQIFADAVRGADNKFAGLFHATRVKPLAQAGRYISENVDFARFKAADLLRSGEVPGPEHIKPGDGKLVRFNGKMMAVSRNEAGEYRALAATCTHMACDVHWNSAEKTWDCPCHGSRFDTEGNVLNGPAVRALPKVVLPVTPRPRRERRRAPEQPGASA